MFDETLVVQSAISAFNNAALLAPTFFWVGVLALPLMALAYFYGADFMRRIGWRANDLIRNASIFSVVVTLLWLVLFGGNYNVLRDGQSVLPFCVSAVVFICTLMLGAVSRDVPCPILRDMTWRRRLLVILGALVVAFLVGMSGLHTWWGILMQIAAFGGGFILGRMMPRVDAPVSVCSIVVLAVSTLILMQPEFFRFGQLGALSIIHMLALLAVGGSFAAVVALAVVRSRGRVYHSAYVKLKWMMRFVAMLAVVLFVLTESVPVFLAVVAVLFIMFAMSVWHAKKVSNNLWVRFYAIMLGAFGLITTLPVISALGVMLWVAADSQDNRFSDSKFLL